MSLCTAVRPSIRNEDAKKDRNIEESRRHDLKSDSNDSNAIFSRTGSEADASPKGLSSPDAGTPLSFDEDQSQALEHRREQVDSGDAATVDSRNRRDNHQNRDSGGGNSNAAAPNSREDHRLHGYRGSGDSSGATSRLHRHISKDYGNDSLPSLTSSNGSGDSLRGGDDIENVDDRIVGAGREARQRRLDSGGASNEFGGPGALHRKLSNSSYSNNTSLQTMPGRTSSFNSSEASDDLNPSEGDDYSQGRDANGASINAAEDKHTAQSYAVSASTSAPLRRLPQPTVAPPRRARDGLLEIEAAASIGGYSGGNRSSIEDLLIRKHPSSASDAKSSSNLGATAELPGEKRTSGEDDAKHISSGAKDAGDDGDDDIDFKVYVVFDNPPFCCQCFVVNSSIMFLKTELTARRRAVAASSHLESHEEPNGTATSTTKVPQPSSRPPRPPQGVKMPYASSVAAVTTTHLNNLRGGTDVSSSSSLSPRMPGGAQPRSTTPPRQSADPGAKVDRDFVNEDWDVGNSQPTSVHDGRFVANSSRGDESASGENSYGAPQYVADNYDRHHHFDDDDEDDLKALAQYSADAKKTQSAVPSQPYVGASVKADSNWLDENFDD
jgi:hypothetical protein